MYFPKCLSLADVVHAVRCGQYRTASAISMNLVRNTWSAANSTRRSKWYLR
jgi:hypothetical protein